MFWEMGSLGKVLKTFSTFCALVLLTPPIYAASVLVQSHTSTHVVHSHSSQVVSGTTGNVVGNATGQDGQEGVVVSGTSVHTHEVSVSRTSVGTSGNVEIHTSGTTGNVENTVSTSFRYELIDLSGIIRGASKPGRKFYRAVGRKISHMVRKVSINKINLIPSAHNTILLDLMSEEIAITCILNHSKKKPNTCINVFMFSTVLLQTHRHPWVDIG